MIFNIYINESENKKRTEAREFSVALGKSFTLPSVSYSTYEDMKNGVSNAPENCALSLDKESLTLTDAESVQLTATFAFSDDTEWKADKDYVWSSADSSVATVDENGLVTSVGKGETTVTVSAVGGKFTATCAVEVTEDIKILTYSDNSAKSLTPAVGTYLTVPSVTDYTVNGEVQDLSGLTVKLAYPSTGIAETTVTAGGTTWIAIDNECVLQYYLGG